MSGSEIGLPEALERAASALPKLADQIRPANGDPAGLARELDERGAQQLLAWLLEHESAAGAELALCWVEDEDWTAPVLALAPDSLAKPARKALRRVLHRLRSRGVEVPDAPAPATVAKLAPVDERLDEARITAFDPQGVRLAYLVQERPGGGARVFELAFDEREGVLEFEAHETSRSQARKFLRGVERRERWMAVPVPSDSVRVLIDRVADLRPRDRTPPREFPAWRRRLCEGAEGAEAPAALVRAALGEITPAVPEDLEQVAGWMRDTRLGPWPPPLDALRPLIDRLDEIAQEVGEGSAAAREEQVEAALREAVPAVFTEAERELLARRFEESAYVFWRSEREDDARRVLAAAASVRTSAAEEHPIARAILETVLAPAIERAREGAKPDEDSAGDGAAAGSAGEAG